MSIAPDRVSEVEGKAGYSTGPPESTAAFPPQVTLAQLTAMTSGMKPSPRAEAEAIGEAIRTGADNLWRLLHQAEATRAWEALDLPDLPSFVAHYVPAEQRRPLVAELRAEGASTRAIAEATGVSQTQVLRDLQVNPPVHLPAVITFDEPTTVTGLDGKTYKSKSSTKKERRKRFHETATAIREAFDAENPSRVVEREREAFQEACVTFIEAQGWHTADVEWRKLAAKYSL
jgi:hypothetical protein